jgi:putative ABC transport system permease protein
MGMIFTIALRSIGRHKRRTMLSAITIAVGLTVFIFMDSLLSGVDRISIDNMIDLTTGALKIQTTRYDKEKSAFPLDYGLQDSAAALEHALLGDKRVTHVARRTRFLGQLSNYSETVPVVGTVIDEAADTAVFRLKPCIQGGYFSADNRREILLGGRLAQELGVAVGDNITLYALTKYDSRNADEFKIVGLLGTADPAINQSAVFITYGAADDFLDLENTVTEIDAAMVRMSNLADFEKAARALQKKLEPRFPGMSIGTFAELGAGVLQLTHAKRVFGMVFMLVILIIAVVGIFNTVFMSVYERIREIGVLRAHGMKPSEISALFVLEGVITGAIGSVFGVALGCLLNVYLVLHGLPLEKIAGRMATAQYGISGNVYGQWNAPAMILIFVLGIVMATLAGIIPARRASRFEVAAALRFA